MIVWATLQSLDPAGVSDMEIFPNSGIRCNIEMAAEVPVHALHSHLHLVSTSITLSHTARRAKDDTKLGSSAFPALNAHDPTMDPLDCLSQPPSSASRSISRPTEIQSCDLRNHAGTSSSRSTTPSLANPPRSLSRSSSVFSSFSSFASRVDKYKSDKLQKERYESALRLQTTWEALAEKYGSIPPEEDDEVDLRTGKIVKDRGKLRELEAREFGELQDEPGYEGWEFDSDEDEIGVWDERSGLDEQFPKYMAAEKAWTKEDENDLASFLRAEAARRRAQGSAESEDTEEDSAAQLSSRMEARETTTTPRIESLVSDDQSSSSSGDDLAAGLVSPSSSPRPVSPVGMVRRLCCWIGN